jgi:hypothetical protein
MRSRVSLGVLASKRALAYVLVSVLLMLTVSLLPMLGFAQSSASQNLLRNGDFSNGLTGWTKGVLKPSHTNASFGPYPKIETVGTGPGAHASLDVPGGGAAYLESDPFMLPDKRGGYTLNATVWAQFGPTILEIQLRTQMGIYTVDSFEPPKVELGQQPVVKQYFIPTNFTGQNVALRFSCFDTPPGHHYAVYCKFSNVIIPPPPLPPVNSVASSIVIAMGLATAAAGVALALHASSSAQGGSKLGTLFHAYLASLALAIAAVLSRKFCCACAGACNHTGPHSFCPAHDPRTLYSRMQIVYTTYCRHCGRKLEDHECREPVVEAPDSSSG